ASEDMDGVKPGFGQSGPMSDRKVGGAEAVAVAALSKDMQLSRDLGLLQCLKVDERVLFVDGVVLGLKQESRRSVRGGVDALCELVEGGCVGEIAGVDDEGEVGASAGLICWFAGALVVGVIAENGREMGAS